jgi:hypothetical protein
MLQLQEFMDRGSTWQILDSTTAVFLDWGEYLPIKSGTIPRLFNFRVDSIITNTALSLYVMEILFQRAPVSLYLDHLT